MPPKATPNVSPSPSPAPPSPPSQGAMPVGPDAAAVTNEPVVSAGMSTADTQPSGAVSLNEPTPALATPSAAPKPSRPMSSTISKPSQPTSSVTHETSRPTTPTTPDPPRPSTPPSPDPEPSASSSKPRPKAKPASKRPSKPKPASKPQSPPGAEAPAASSSKPRPKAKRSSKPQSSNADRSRQSGREGEDGERGDDGAEGEEEEGDGDEDEDDDVVGGKGAGGEEEGVEDARATRRARRDDIMDRISYYIHTFAPLIAHMIAVAGTFIFLQVFVKGHNFNVTSHEAQAGVSDSPKTGWRLLQTDVVTLLSVLLIIVRICLSWWIKVVMQYAWITLRKSKYTPQIIPPSTWLPKPAKLLKGRPRVRHPVFVFTVAALAVPFLVSQFTDPIILGSITWTPTSTIVEGLPLNITLATNNQKWSAYQSDRSVRRSVVDNAALIATKAWANATANDPPQFKRVLYRVNDISLVEGTEINNISVPYITLSNFNWVQDIADVPIEQCRSVFLGDLLLNVSSTDNPMHAYPGERNVALIPETNSTWRQQNIIQPSYYDPSSGTRYRYPEYEFPEPEIFSANLYSVLYAGYIQDNATEHCATQVPPQAQNGWLNDVITPDGRRPCYAFASVDVLAGVSTCEKCKIHSRDVISSSTTYAYGDPGLKPDPLVREAITLIPEVASAIVRSHPNIPTTPIEQYMQTVITRAYMAAWNALVDNTDPTEFGTVQSAASVGVESTAGVVNQPRAWIWFALQASVWVAALFLITIHQYGLRPEVRPPIRYRNARVTNDVEQAQREMEETEGVAELKAW